MTDGVDSRPPRFIAGAVCPRCSAMDRIVVSPDGDTRSCVECGFTDARPGETPTMVPTRVTRAASRRLDTPAEAVRLIDPGRENGRVGPEDTS